MKKQCSKCKKTKNVNCFYKDKHAPDGYMYTCIECILKRLHEPEIREKRLKSNKEWHKKNKERIRIR